MSKKDKILLTLAIVISVIIALPFVAIGGMFLAFSVQSESKLSNLRNVADDRATSLTELTILDGQKTKAKPIVSGDGLTANSDPGISAYATAEFDTQGTLAAIRAQIDANLAAAGYTPMSDAEGLLYSTDNVIGNDGVTRTQLEMYYKKDAEHVITVDYQLEQDLSCVIVSACGNATDSSANQQQRYTSQFDSTNVGTLYVYLQAERGSNSTY